MSLSVGVSAIAAGRGLPVEVTETVGLVTSVKGGLPGLAPGMNSETFPMTVTSLPIAAAGSALDVKTRIPSDVFGSASASASGVWMKKPLLLTPVTMPLMVTACPLKGD